MGVADAVSCLRLLAADITLLCHDHSRKLQNLMQNIDFTGDLMISARSHDSAVARFRQL
jgi:hypothetical protein